MLRALINSLSKLLNEQPVYIVIIVIDDDSNWTVWPGTMILL